MAVGQDESVGREDQPRSMALLLAGGGAATPVADFHTHDGRGHLFDDSGNGAGIGVQQLGVGGRNRRGGRRLIVRQPSGCKREKSAHASRTPCGSRTDIFVLRMRDALQALLREASDAKRSVDFWHAAAGILSGWAGGARLSIRYQGINEAGSVSAGTDDRSGRSLNAAWHDPDGRRGEATLAGAPPALPP